MWVRGLKLNNTHRIKFLLLSHPMWVRGLKLNKRTTFRSVEYVAPYVGAWIETLITKESPKQSDVAPYVGAWIETLSREVSVLSMLSHPMWVRGLKLTIRNIRGEIFRRTLCGCVD